MNKIATHNSGTGERSANFWSTLLIPFARCQSKTIKEQADAGCTYFDLRVDDDFHIAHGKWHSSTTLEDALYYINYCGLMQEQEMYVQVTYEYSLNDTYPFIKKVIDIMESYKYIKLLLINVKKPYWKNIYRGDKYVRCDVAFKNLDGSSWHTYVPIPWLWDKIYHHNHEFDDNYYKMTDFL